MNNSTILDIALEDFEELIIKIEDSFEFRFSEGEIRNKITIDELAKIVISKIDLKEGIECSNQIVFFKLRKLLSERMKLEHSEITPDSKLKGVFPKKKRRNIWKQTFDQFELPAPELSPNTTFLIFTLLAALISFFFIFGENWIYGLSIFSTSVLAVSLMYKFGKSLPAETIGEFAQLIVEEKYLRVRKHLGSINKKEVREIIFATFTDWLEQEERDALNMNTMINFEK